MKASRQAGSLTYDPHSSPEESARIDALFPELKWIDNDDLRDVVVQIWVHAWRASTWVDPTDAYTISYLPRWNLVAHTRMVVALARQTAMSLSDEAGLPFDNDMLVAAALLHDAAKLVEFEPGPDGPRKSAIGNTVHHATVGAQWALEAGLAPDIAQAIFSHTPTVNVMPSTPEGLIIKMIDHTTAEVTRMVTKLETQAKAEHHG